MRKEAIGKVVQVFGNLVHVLFEGNLSQGEIAMIQLGSISLKGEVIEIFKNQVKVQVFEDTRNIKLGTPVTFSGDLLEAELGPGLLGAIVDGLQNPLEKIAEASGLFLSKGIYFSSLDYTKKWEYDPVAQLGDSVQRGSELGYTMEGNFRHSIMVPFLLFGNYRLIWVAKRGSYTIDTVIAKATDLSGNEYEFTMVQKWPVKKPLLIGEKIKASEMMETGERIIDTQFPILKGGTFCLPGPFGAGKTVLQQHLAKYASVHIVVFVACGERAGEVVEMLRNFPHLTNPQSGDPLINRTVIICNTSSMPVAAREASIYMGVTIAEYYRQMGLDVLLLADSTSRWAQAMREISGRLEEIPGEEAFPAYLASRISEFYERAGVVNLEKEKRGSLTIGGTVSPAGGNFEEPVTQATLAVVGAFLALSRSRSDARRYPAIDPLLSWSKYVKAVAAIFKDRFPQWGSMVERASDILRKGDEIRKRMEVVGEEGVSLEEIVVYLKSELYEFSYLQQNEFDPEDAYSSMERQNVSFAIISKIFTSYFRFHNHDAARSFFLDLQSTIKGANFLSFQSDPYLESIAHIEEKISKALGELL